MFQSRKFYLSLLGVIAWSSTTADTVLGILEAASLSAADNSLFRIAAASGALDAASLCCIGVYTFRNVRRSSASEDSRTLVRALVGASILLSSTALIITLALIILLRSKQNEIIQSSSKGPISDWTSLISAQIALWVVSLIGQIGLYHIRAPRLSHVRTPELSPHPKLVLDGAY
jgi:hypothetical protein